MKKILVSILGLALCIFFALSGCTKSEEHITNNQSTQPTPGGAEESTRPIGKQASSLDAPSEETEDTKMPPISNNSVKPDRVSPEATLSDTSPLSAYQSVLQYKAKFFSTDANKNLNINQLNQAVSDDSSVTAKATKLAIVDLENDGTPEVILWLAVNNNDYYGFEVLRYQDGVVYGYTLWYRAFMDLKADGTFSFSSGAADHGFGTVKFTKNAYSVDKISYCESGYDSNNNQSVSYFVDHKSATEDDFLSAINKQSEKTEATWYDFADDNVKTMLSNYKQTT